MEKSGESLLSCTVRSGADALRKILHEMNHAVTEPQPAQWDFLDDNEAEVASKRETESYKKHYSNVYCCVICLERMGIRKIEHHVLYQ